MTSTNLDLPLPIGLINELIANRDPWKNLIIAEPGSLKHDIEKVYIALTFREQVYHIANLIKNSWFTNLVHIQICTPPSPEYLTAGDLSTLAESLSYIPTLKSVKLEWAGVELDVDDDLHLPWGQLERVDIEVNHSDGKAMRWLSKCINAKSVILKGVDSGLYHRGETPVVHLPNLEHFYLEGSIAAHLMEVLILPKMDLCTADVHEDYDDVYHCEIYIGAISGASLSDIEAYFGNANM